MITHSLKINLRDKEIGRLSWDERKKLAYFEYSREFLNGSLDIFPLIASIHSPISNRPIMGDTEKKIYRRLPPFLADSLPDAWGNQVFECWRKENEIRNQDITPLDLLSFIGKRGMGALEFIPESSGMRKSEVLNLKSLTDLAHRIFAERENISILPEESLTMQALIAVGTSAGGRQPKAIIAINNETGEIRSGQISFNELSKAPGEKGFEYYILKFGDPERSSAELEMAYYDMATAAGIDMMPCKLIDVDGQKHFMTKRFDRDVSRKVHMQTLAALYPEADSYEQLLMVCRKMRLPASTQEKVFRRLVYNILANNTDDHNKNFSFLMDENGKWSLSPAYDMTYIFNDGGYLPETMHCLMMNGKFSRFTLDDVLGLAKDNGISKAKEIIQDVVKAVSNFRMYAERYGAQQRWINAIETCISDYLLSWGFITPKQSPTLTLPNGTALTDIHVEQTYKGLFHLMASINGRERKFVINKNNEDFKLIEQCGATNLSNEQLLTLAQKYFH